MSWWRKKRGRRKPGRETKPDRLAALSMSLADHALDGEMPLERRAAVAHLRALYRSMKSEPKGSPLRAAVDKWEEGRARVGGPFAVPESWRRGLNIEGGPDAD